MRTPPTPAELRAAVADLPRTLQPSAVWFAALPLACNPLQMAARATGTDLYAAAAEAGRAQAGADAVFPDLGLGPAGWVRALPSPRGCLLVGTHLLGVPPLILPGVTPHRFDQQRASFAAAAHREGVTVAVEQLWQVTPELPGGARVAHQGETPDGGLEAVVERFSRWGTCTVEVTAEQLLLDVEVATHRVSLPLTFAGASVQVGVPVWRWDRGVAPPAALLPLPVPLLWVGADRDTGVPLARLDGGGPAGEVTVSCPGEPG